MAKYYDIPVSFYGKSYKFNRFLGLLTIEDGENVSSSNDVQLNVDGDKKLCLDAVNNPFLIRQEKKTNNDKKIKHQRIALRWAQLLTLLSAHCYPLAYLCSHLRFNLFDNAEDAVQFYYRVYPSFKLQRVLCLPRAIFAATTSKRFNVHGAMFIGSFLPTVRMHAWVMEDGCNADVYDGQWICFKPVMMMV